MKVLAGLIPGSLPACHAGNGFGRDSPMKKMFLKLKLIKKNTALALSTVFGRLTWP
jgi:hypothetical protein